MKLVLAQYGLFLFLLLGGVKGIQNLLLSSAFLPPLPSCIRQGSEKPGLRQKLRFVNIQIKIPHEYENLKNTLLVSVVCEIKLANHNLDVGLQKLFWLEQITNISVIVNVGQFRGLNNIFPFLQLPLVQFLSTLITLSRSDYRVIKEPIPCYELRLLQIQKCVK